MFAPNLIRDFLKQEVGISTHYSQFIKCKKSLPKNLFIIKKQKT